ncbi:MAG: cysteine--tRNA ligase [Pelotomaculaceae bacterium]|jgi:cysteinyl-tRNA synthetase|uniref:Cysteine--tRNA ligase n=1 Tax=anaerobic digester metagenome TaxID=1263854 RepID=A0A485M6L5_9ZZZZ|nr:cysteine--tRNA ligase [Bacillota bacterium]HHU85782.1 cysteine--tRNA ligase [Peptococcaceae bacterium]
MEIYNTLTRRKETFQPREPGKVYMYVCGPTTYNYIHLGNARPLVFFDTVRRYLAYRGYDVLYVQNFTDVDDKIINRAREEGEDPLSLARKYIDEYFKDADALNVRRADRHPRVSGHMPDIVRVVEELVQKGSAYEVDGDVYFEVRKFPGYGKLSGRSLEDMQAGARVEVDTRKRDPMDFAVWKAAKPGEPSWDSPWGPGRPGWHIECSVMSLKYLGPGFDIHGGGYDLIFPHHENEIAQSEAATGKTFVRYWMHNGFITVKEEKMSKSLGNFFLVRDILAKFSPEVVRFFLLSTHYRSPLDFDDEKLAAAGRGLERIKTSIRLLTEALAREEEMRGEGDGEAGPGPAEVPGKGKEAADSLKAALDEMKASFESAMDDDFNTALAISVIFDLAREVNSLVQQLGAKISLPEKEALQKAMALFNSFNEVTGIFKVDPAGRILLEDTAAEKSGLTEGLLSLIIDIRQEARKKKDWATADRIRDGLKELGIILEDTPRGVRWKKQG